MFIRLFSLYIFLLTKTLIYTKFEKRLNDLIHTLKKNNLIRTQGSFLLNIYKQIKKNLSLGRRTKS